MAGISRRGLFLLWPVILGAQQPQPGQQEPPEEDESLRPKEYAFNPLQAESELKVGHFYLRKGSYLAASRRFEEATKWDPSMAEAFLRLGECREKLKDMPGAKVAYLKYLELAPDGKAADGVRKRIGQRK